LRRKTGHRIAGGAVFSIVMIEVAHMAQHALGVARSVELVG
jgi:hypothetical protein